MNNYNAKIHLIIFSAGRSSADVALTVKPRPGVFPSSEEIERQHHNQLDPGKDLHHSYCFV